MLWTIVLILLAIWLLGFLLKIAGTFIHLLLIVVIVVIAYRYLTSRRAS